MKKEIEIPKGCKKITIEVVEGERIIVTYSSNINNEILCKETGEMEELPKVGDFCIFWDDYKRDVAVCANLVRCDFVQNQPLKRYIASTGNNFRNAIKFRNYEQYLRVKGIYGEDEP